MSRSDSKAEDRKVEIGAAITDEKPVDWDQVESDTGDEDASWFARMRELEQVSRAFRGASAEQQAAAGSEALFSWGTLEVRAKLGEGTFGHVYRAYDPALDREVALKLRRGEAHSLDVADQRMIREAQRLARLHHSNVVAVHGAGMHDGKVGFWTDLIDGRSLSDAVEGQSPLSAEEAASVGLSLCRALAAVHDAGLVHGDVKPSNVMREEGGRIVLMDFGAASALSETGDEVQRHDLQGTPATLAPELLEGERSTPVSDLYSLGALLYFLVSGFYPLEADSFEELLADHRAGKAVRLRDRRPDLPSGFVEVVDRALARDPADRFASAGAMEHALLKALAPASARTGREELDRGRTTAASTWWRQRPRVLLATGAFVAALGLAGVGYWFSESDSGADTKPFAGSVAVLPFRAEAVDPAAEYLSYGLNEALIAELARTPELRVIAYDSARRAVSGGTSPRQAARDLGVEHLITANAATHDGRVEVDTRLMRVDTGEIVWAERFGGPVSEALRLHEEIARRVVRDVLRRLAPAVRTRHEPVDPLALARYLEGRHAWSQRQRASVERSVDLFRQATDLEPTFAEAWAGLADAYAILGTYGWMPMEESHPMARAAATRALEIDPDSAEAHASLALVLSDYYWEWGEALDHFDAAVRLQPGYATAHQWYAEELAKAGRFDEALAQARRAWQLDPLSPTTDLTVGETLYKARRYSEAIEHLSGTVRRHPEYGIAELVLALAEIQEGRVQAAVSRLEDARRRWPDLLEIVSLLGYAYGVADRTQDAHTVLNELEERSASVHVAPILFAYPQVGLGNHDAALGRLEEALEARDWQIKLLGVDPILDPLRDEPRFSALLSRVGLARSGD